MDNQRKKNVLGTTPLNTYQKTNVLTASRETLLLMLYRAAVQSIRGTIQATEANDLTRRNEFSTKAQEIVTELRSSLNFDVSKELAENLDRLYVFVGQRLFEGTLNNNIVFLNEALKTMETLYEGWSEAIASLKKERKETQK